MIRRLPSHWSEAQIWLQVRVAYGRAPQPGPFPAELLAQVADKRLHRSITTPPVGDVWRYALVFDLDPALLPRGARHAYPRDDRDPVMRWFAWCHHWEPDPGRAGERWTRCASPHDASAICEAWVGEAGELIDPRAFAATFGIARGFVSRVQSHQDFGNRPHPWEQHMPVPGGFARSPSVYTRRRRWRPFS